MSLAVSLFLGYLIGVSIKALRAALLMSIAAGIATTVVFGLISSLMRGESFAGPGLVPRLLLGSLLHSALVCAGLYFGRRKSKKRLEAPKF